MRLYNYAKVIRSKNAGPFTFTIDMIFDEKDRFENVLIQLKNRISEIASLYSVKADDVQINDLSQVLAIKVSFPRSFTSSGSIGDRDVYGCQQHFPLADIEITES
ncbi:MAG: DUF4387 family protein [Sedimentisphaerales bacterium]|nr:DUF4387 family protein [Sedimentisphaerales bacterium]